MITTTKHSEFFQPLDVTDAFHIIGCGAIGSHIGEQLARLGLTNIHLYDFDIVTDHNIANQMYVDSDIGTNKLEALQDYMLEINPDIETHLHLKGWIPGTYLSGYVFMCVDSVTVRQEILKDNKYNNQIKSFFDFRMRLSDAQHYAAPGGTEGATALLKTMTFTEEEAKDATPISACGTTLSILPTVKIITSCGISNLINFIKGQPLKKLILIDAFDFTIDAY